MYDHRLAHLWFIQNPCVKCKAVEPISARGTHFGALLHPTGLPLPAAESRLADDHFYPAVTAMRARTNSFVILKVFASR